ncbi:hypothetical protein GOV12_02380 [Candidatus Pacearchaeota archaeon]|nr:hypothetical protein [Candidatus Pacearchaeota archaeon]
MKEKRVYTNDNIDEWFVYLDEAVINALEHFSKPEIKFPNVNFNEFKRPLVVGSGNAAVTGKIMFDCVDAVFASESDYLEKLESVSDIDGVIIISASGIKHALIICDGVRKKRDKKIPVKLFICNEKLLEDSSFVKKFDEILLFPKLAEPYTYNTSTYLGMILTKTGENPKDILKFIKKMKYKDFIKDEQTSYYSYCILVPSHLHYSTEMFVTKFVELFWPECVGRSFTIEHARHAVDIIKSDKELFLNLGVKNDRIGKNRVEISLPKDSGYGCALAIGFYLIGRLQRKKPDWFRKGVVDYVIRASTDFGKHIEALVE